MRGAVTDNRFEAIAGQPLFDMQGKGTAKAIPALAHVIMVGQFFDSPEASNWQVLASYTVNDTARFALVYRNGPVGNSPTVKINTGLPEGPDGGFYAFRAVLEDAERPVDVNLKPSIVTDPRHWLGPTRMVGYPSRISAAQEVAVARWLALSLSLSHTHTHTHTHS